MTRVAISTLAIGFFACTLHAQMKGSLTVADVEEAIRSGIAGNVEPYAMYPYGYPGSYSLGRTALQAGVPAPVVVYTPFVRIALYARTAFDRGTMITPADVPPTILEPTAWIGFTWNVCCGREERFKNGRLAILAVFDRAAIRHLGSPEYARAVNDPRGQPLWTLQGTAPLRELGIEAPEQIDAVAAFPVTVVATAKEFRLTRYATFPGEIPDRTPIAFDYVAPVPEHFQTWR